MTYSGPECILRGTNQPMKGFIMHFFFTELLPFCHQVIQHPHCLKFNPVVSAWKTSHHFFSCVG